MRVRRTCTLAAVCLGAIFGGSARAQDSIDTTSLPRAVGTRTLLANPVSTSFMTPGRVEEAGEVYRKILAEAGWQQYDQMSAPHPVPTQIMRFKKGVHGLNVFIVQEPAHGGTTSVNYTAQLLQAVAPDESPRPVAPW